MSGAKESFDAFQDAFDRTNHDKYIEHANRCDNFYVGEQWDEATLAALGDRPALTLNMALRAINAIKGQYSKSRADIIFKAKNDATKEQAQALTYLMDATLDNNKYFMLEQLMFDSGIITDRGYIDIRAEFDNNILGEVKYALKDPRKVILDPDAESMDPDEWNQMITFDWFTPDDLELTYGKDKAEHLMSYVMSEDTLGAKSIRFGQAQTGSMTLDEHRKNIRGVRVIDRQYTRIKRVEQFVDPQTGDVKDINEGMPEDRIRYIVNKYGLLTRSILKKKIYWCVSADQVELFSGWSPYEHFTIVPYFPYFRPGKPAGVMKQLLSPQEQLNKTESQQLHIINTTANSGWMLEAGSLTNMTPEELEKRGAETGLVLVYGKNRQPPAKIESNTIPSGIDRVAAKAQGYISEIPGVTPLVGQEMKSDVSGVALSGAMNVSISGLQPVFDNLKITRDAVGRNTLCLFQSVYTEPRVMRVQNVRSPEPEAEDIQLQINTDALNNITIGKYDVVVSQAPARDTQEETTFAQCIEMRREGIMIPDHYVILASQMANKEEIANVVKNLSGLGEPTPEEMQLQQTMQQLSLEHAFAELQELQAKAQKLSAEAALAQARAESEPLTAGHEASERVARLKLDQEKLQADIGKRLADLQNKLVLADKHIASNERLTRYQALMKAIQAQGKEKSTPAK